MTILPYQDRGYVRFISERTGETLFEITMLDRAMIIWGSHYRPDELRASLADNGATVCVSGILRDSFWSRDMLREGSLIKRRSNGVTHLFERRANLTRCTDVCAQAVFIPPLRCGKIVLGQKTWSDRN